ncbi:histidine triad (HIT) protein [Methylobacterium sp. Leaf465]|uniref:HIT domain-containing protein n=1 Tax=unclassified Methylobacterium TaxID=2615210 RepID=UPI0006F48A3D|nr:MULTISPECIES: HIT domain-containing protein [unclassified Methylobacterium]KQO68205.1 histidine triad (HIT) protein [Methylobacterium sp. Leaf89]KQT76542.1 histidine triad (HIT) protein [Methylobacterium sp. Leaf465]
MEPDFALDPQLAADTVHVGDLTLCSVLLMDDARFPWLILVPRRAGASEITDLAPEDARSLMDEMRIATGVMLALAKPDKVNVAALGNVVAQLHVHVIGRFHSDPAWPKPIWGIGTATPYPHHARAQMIERIGALFAAA